MKRAAAILGLVALAVIVANYAPAPAQVPTGALTGFTPGLGITTTANPITVLCTNDGATGTTNGLLVKLSAAQTCINAATTDGATASQPIIGIVVSGGAIGGTSQVAIAGVVSCTFDNATTFRHQVQASSSVAGNCDDTGSNNTGSTNGGSTIGQVLDTGAAGAHFVLLNIRPVQINTLWLGSARIDSSAFNGQFRIEQASGAAGTCLQFGGSASTNPALGDSGALLKVLQAGTSCTGDGNLGVGHLSSDNAAPPTINSGFGTSPSIVSGGDTAFIVNVGTGGTATSGVIQFGTSFTTAPACMAQDTTTILTQRVTATTSQATITSAAWTASDKVAVFCFGQNGL